MFKVGLQCVGFTSWICIKRCSIDSLDSIKKRDTSLFAEKYDPVQVMDFCTS